jgi:hypothetical protein
MQTLRYLEQCTLASVEGCVDGISIGTWTLLLILGAVYDAGGMFQEAPCIGNLCEMVHDEITFCALCHSRILR